MKRILSIATTFGLALALAACTQAPAATTTSIGTATAAPTGVVASVNSFTSADLSNAIAIATKAGTAAGQPGALIVPCLTYIQGQLTTLQSAGAIPTGTVGVATAFVSADLAASNLTTATSPTTQAAYAVACGPLVLQLTNQGMTLSAQIGALVALLPK